MSIITEGLHKTNTINSALVLEGGAMRGLFTAGILDAFMERGFYFPKVVTAVILTSALCLASLLMNMCLLIMTSLKRLRKRYMWASLTALPGNLFLYRVKAAPFPNLWEYASQAARFLFSQSRSSLRERNTWMAAWGCRLCLSLKICHFRAQNPYTS